VTRESISRVVAAIVNLARLERDWDSYGAKPVTAEAIKAAIAFVEKHDPESRLPIPIPSPDGGIELEWNDRIIIDFGPDGSIGCVWVEP